MDVKAVFAIIMASAMFGVPVFAGDTDCSAPSTNSDLFSNISLSCQLNKPVGNMTFDEYKPLSLAVERQSFVFNGPTVRQRIEMILSYPPGWPSSGAPLNLRPEILIDTR